jgi:hypothetical protein
VLFGQEKSNHKPWLKKTSMKSYNFGRNQIKKKSKTTKLLIKLSASAAICAYIIIVIIVVISINKL